MASNNSFINKLVNLTSRRTVEKALSEVENKLKRNKNMTNYQIQSSFMKSVLDKSTSAKKHLVEKAFMPNLSSSIIKDSEKFIEKYKVKHPKMKKELGVVESNARLNNRDSAIAVIEYMSSSKSVEDKQQVVASNLLKKSNLIHEKNLQLRSTELNNSMPSTKVSKTTNKPNNVNRTPPYQRTNNKYTTRTNPRNVRTNNYSNVVRPIPKSKEPKFTNGEKETMRNKFYRLESQLEKIILKSKRLSENKSIKAIERRKNKDSLVRDLSTVKKQLVIILGKQYPKGQGLRVSNLVKDGIKVSTIKDLVKNNLKKIQQNKPILSIQELTMKVKSEKVNMSRSNISRGKGRDK